MQRVVNYEANKLKKVTKLRFKPSITNKFVPTFVGAIFLLMNTKDSSPPFFSSSYSIVQTDWVINPFIKGVQKGEDESGH